MRIESSNAQHRGAREQQQDALGLTDVGDLAFVEHAGVLAVVCDGMGGMEKGDEAGVVARSTFVRAYERKAPQTSIPEALMQAMQAANQAVYEMASRFGQTGAIGTTVVAAVVHKAEVYWLSVGDSRVYLLRSGTLTQLNRDQVLRGQRLREVALGVREDDGLSREPRPDALTSHLGMAEIVEADCNLYPLPLLAEDQLLLCSDGIYGSLTEVELRQGLAQPAKEAAGYLVEQVLDKQLPSQDNLTAIVIGFEQVRAGVQRGLRLRASRPPDEDLPPTVRQKGLDELPVQRAGRGRALFTGGVGLYVGMLIGALLTAVLLLIIWPSAEPPVQVSPQEGSTQTAADPAFEARKDTDEPARPADPSPPSPPSSDGPAEIRPEEGLTFEESTLKDAREEGVVASGGGSEVSTPGVRELEREFADDEQQQRRRMRERDGKRGDKPAADLSALETNRPKRHPKARPGEQKKRRNLGTPGRGGPGTNSSGKAKKETTGGPQQQPKKSGDPSATSQETPGENGSADGATRGPTGGSTKKAPAVGSQVEQENAAAVAGEAEK